MTRTADGKTDRFQMRIPPQQKATIARAAALSHKDMADFILDKVMPAAEAVIEAAEVSKVSERDFVRILELLDHPPKANPKLRAAIAALSDTL